MTVGAGFSSRPVYNRWQVNSKMGRRDEAFPAGVEPDQLDMMVQAAELYYELGLIQEEIARRLNVSRPTVSRLLQQAREHDIVRITVVNPRSRADELQRRLIESWSLRDAVVVPTTVGKGRLLVRKLGEVGAQYVEQRLTPGRRLGLGLGQTVYSLVHALEGIQSGPHVVPLCGGTVFAESAYHVNELARVAAQKLGGFCHFLHAPATASSEAVYEALINDKSVADVIRLWDELDWAVIGIGSARHAETPEFRKFVDEAVAAGHVPVADICQTLVDASGRACPSPGAERLIAVRLEQLRRTPTVVAVAGGVHKADAIRAALGTGAVDVLITDEPTAVAMLADSPESSGSSEP